MGSELNEAEDSEPVMRFYGAWLRRYLESGAQLGAEAEAARADFERALGAHLSGLEGRSGPWGVKVPRSILMLRYWHAAFPGLRFVHVVRDGLDMAYSRDRNQLRMVGDLVLDRAERRLGEIEQAIAYWQRVNLEAADYGQRRLPGRYLLVRFEDLCARPSEAYARVRDLVGGRRAAPDEIAAEVRAPASIGRWRRRPVQETRSLREVGAAALRRFGYAAP
jgi:hypothetical protein